jgi:cytochrome d ubiquinol oxidase subunit I
LGVAGIHAFLLLLDRENAFHRRALAVAMLVGAPAAVLQPISGHHSGQVVAEYQPAKLAALEAHFQTGPRAPIELGGWPDMDARKIRYAVPIPGGLSVLAFNDPNAVVKGLDRFPRADWPNVPIVHFAFQLMVGLGTYMAIVALWGGWLALRRHDYASHRGFLRALSIAAPMGFIAIEAGWTVTEVGRQPWTIYGVLRTADAVTPMPGLIVPFLSFTLLYCFLGVIVVWLVYNQIVRSPRPTDWSRRYRPPDARGG